MSRPEGWKKKYPDPCTGCKDKARPGSGDLTSAKYCLEQCTEDDEYDQFEDGADAMLGELRKKGVHYGPSDIWRGQHHYWTGTGKSGTWVFIPDDISD